MQARISSHVGSVARQIHMGTFHSIFGKILRQHAPLLGYTSDYSIYNTSDSRSRIKAIIKQLGLDDKVYKPNVVHNRISSAKNRLITASAYASYTDFLKYDAKSGLPKLYEIYQHYEAELKRSNAMDFDDLLLQINILFRQHPDVLKLWQDRIDYLLIDEYQDTNFAQYMIARQLMQDKGAIFVVGDDAQSIYSFRGANLDNILSFEKDLSPTPAPSSSSATTAPRRPSSRLRGRSSQTMSTRSPRMSSRRSLSVSPSPCMRHSRVTSKPSGSPTRCSAFIVMAIPTARWLSSIAPMRRAVPLSRSSAV